MRHIKTVSRRPAKAAVPIDVILEIITLVSSVVAVIAQFTDSFEGKDKEESA